MTNAAPPHDDLVAAMKRVGHEVLTHEERPGWIFRLGQDGRKRVAIAPEGDHDEALIRLRVKYQERLGPTEVGSAPVDPADPGKGERPAVFVVGAPYPVPAAEKKKG